MTTSFMAINDDWLARTVEPTLEPELPICDPHHHLWDFRPGVVAPRYLLDDFLEDLASGHNIVSTVFVECGTMFRADGPDALRPVGETEFAAGVAATSESGRYGPTRVAAGIVGTAYLTLGDAVTEVLDRQIEAGGGRFRGIRQGRGVARGPGRAPTIAPGRRRTCISTPGSATASGTSPRAGSRSKAGATTPRSRP